VARFHLIGFLSPKTFFLFWMCLLRSCPLIFVAENLAGPFFPFASSGQTASQSNFLSPVPSSISQVFPLAFCAFLALFIGRPFFPSHPVLVLSPRTTYFRSLYPFSYITLACTVHSDPPFTPNYRPFARCLCRGTRRTAGPKIVPVSVFYPSCPSTPFLHGGLLSSSSSPVSPWQEGRPSLVTLLTDLRNSLDVFCTLSKMTGLVHRHFAKSSLRSECWPFTMHRGRMRPCSRF